MACSSWQELINRTRTFGSFRCSWLIKVKLFLKYTSEHKKIRSKTCSEQSFSSLNMSAFKTGERFCSEICCTLFSYLFKLFCTLKDKVTSQTSIWDLRKLLWKCNIVFAEVYQKKALQQTLVLQISPAAYHPFTMYQETAQNVLPFCSAPSAKKTKTHASFQQ